jgi:hypothetical protein
MTRDELIGEVVTCMANCGYSLASWPPKKTGWREQL